MKKPSSNDACEHGIGYDDTCSECEALTLLARIDGAETPREIGIWSRAYARHENLRRGIAATADLADEVVALDAFDSWNKGWRQAHRKAAQDLRALLGGER